MAKRKYKKRSNTYDEIPHEVTDATKMRVTLLAAWGRDHKRIADVLRISVVALKRHYEDLLIWTSKDRAWVARDRVNLQLAETFLEQFIAGNVQAGRELVAMMQVSDTADVPLPSSKLGKKERARIEAQQPDLKSPLGELMAARDKRYVGFELHRLAGPDRPGPVAAARPTAQ